MDLSGPGMVGGTSRYSSSLEGERLRLGTDGEGGAYGITAVGGDTHAAEKREEKGGMRLIIREIKQPKSVQPGRYQRWSSLVAAKWNHAIQILALFLTAVLLVLILYYENTSLDTAFEAFMDNQSFGVHILFATFGIAISAFWDYLFSREYHLHIQD